MPAAIANIAIDIGRDYTLWLLMQTPEGNPVDLRGCTMIFCIKNQVTDTDAQSIYYSTVPSGGNLAFGQVVFHISHETTQGFPSNPNAVYGISGITAPDFAAELLTGTCALTQPVRKVVP